MGDNLEFAGQSLLKKSSESSTLFHFKSVFDGTDARQDVFNLSQFEDFGRESLGIIDINHPDFGRESLSFLHNPLVDDFGRESLGIVNLNNLDIGRESLGITNIKTCDVIVNLDDTTVNDDNSINSLLNMGFLKQSSFNSNPSLHSSDNRKSETSFNSNRINSVLNGAFLNTPTVSISSSISSINPSFYSFSSNTTDIMNNALHSTSDFIKQLFKKSSTHTDLSKKCNSDKLQRRISSLPTVLEPQLKEFRQISVKSAQDDKCNNSKILENDFPETVSCSEANEGFNDSVFVEASLIAARIADGSILNLDPLENNILDSTQEPEDLANVFVEDEDVVKVDKETVFKIVDKMFLPSSVSQEVPKDKSNVLLEDNSRTSPRNDDLNSSSKSNSSTKSKGAMEMLTSLSEILNNDNPSEKQKSEGKHLLSSLAEILLSSASTKSRSCVFDDSGHSSIESEQVAISEAGECYEVLDLRKKNTPESNINQIESNENCIPLDLSMKSKSANSEKTFVSPKMLPPKFNRNHRSLINLSNKSTESNCSLSSNENRSLTDLNKIFKPRKIEPKLSNMKKGPMKAVLSVDTMARKSEAFKITPTRVDSNLSSYKMKKTSTPVNERNLKPMAQSTPSTPKTSHSASSLGKLNNSINSSPRLVKQKLINSGKNLAANKSFESKNKVTTFSKRASIGDQKTSQYTKTTDTGRYSVGEKSELSKKTGDNIKNTSVMKKRHSYSYSKTEQKSVLKENRSRSLVRSSLGKKCGKENLY